MINEIFSFLHQFSGYAKVIFFDAFASIINIDKILASFIPTIRTESLTKIFTYITYFGTSQVVIAFLVAVTFILIINQKARYIIPLLISTIGASVSVYISKIAFHRPRPDIAIYYEPSYSFPSGHATIAVALYGFVAYLIIHFLKSTKQKLTTIFFALIFILLIGISRIYLGEHYLSDVYSGYLLGTLWLIIGIAITKVLEEKNIDINIKPIKYKKILTYLAVFGFLAFYISFSQIFHYKKLSPKIQTIIKISNLQQINKFTQSIIGVNTWPINVVFIGDFEKIKNTLLQKGWKEVKIPFPVFWNYKNADLTLKKIDSQNMENKLFIFKS